MRSIVFIEAAALATEHEFGSPIAKWEEFFGAWLEMHGQSILIVYGQPKYFLSFYLDIELSSNHLESRWPLGPPCIPKIVFFASLKLALIMVRLEHFNYLFTQVSVYHSHLFLVIVRFKRPIEDVVTVTRLKPTNGGTVSAQQGVNMVKATSKILATNISID